VFFLYGHGASGKTYMLRTLAYYIHSEKENCFDGCYVWNRKTITTERSNGTFKV